MMIRNSLFVLCVLVIGCDSRIEELDQFNDSPYFAIDSDTVFTVADSLKLSQGDFRIAPTIVDVNNNLSKIEFVTTNVSGILKVNGASVVESLDVSNSSSISLTYGPSSAGAHSFIVRAVDAFGLTAELDVELITFINIAPVLIATIEEPDTGGPFERIIDASGSFDGDARFGGRITKYEYTFLNITRSIADDTQTVIFPSAGNYQVQVRVKDNDDVWTDLITIPIKIE